MMNLETKREDYIPYLEKTDVVVKNRLDLLNEVIVAIKNLHSYNVPEIIYFRASASDEYNQWINKVTNKLKSKDK